MYSCDIIYYTTEKLQAQASTELMFNKNTPVGTGVFFIVWIA
jgi:hypothetical protein